MPHRLVISALVVMAVACASVIAQADPLDVRIDFNNAAADPAGHWNTLDQDTVNDPTVITDAPLIDYNTGQATAVTVSTAGTRRSTTATAWDPAETGLAWLEPAQDAANDYFWQSQGDSIEDLVSIVVTLKGLTPGAAYTVELISSHNTTSQSFNGRYDINDVFYDGSSTGNWNFKANGYDNGRWMTWTDIVADAEGQLVLTATPIFTTSGYNRGGVRVNALRLTDFTEEEEDPDPPHVPVVYYLDAVNGSDTTGDGSAVAPWASMSKAFSAVLPGDTVLLRPGNYGAVTFKEGNGLGTADGHITYRADPDTTTPRPHHWYEDGLDRPDPADPNGKVIFTEITFDHYSFDKSATTKTGTPEGHYVTLDGLNVVGNNIDLISYVSHVTIRNCNVFGNWGEWSNQVTDNAFNLYRSYYWGSNYRHILIEDCYAENCSGGVQLLGAFHDITVRGCHFNHFSGSIIRFAGPLEEVTFEGNHVHGSEPVPCPLVIAERQVVDPDVDEPNRIFTVDGDSTYHDHATVTDSTTGVTELRRVTSFSGTTLRVVLEEPLSFAVEPGDVVTFHDDTHGSGISVRSGNFTLRGNRIYDCGGTRGIYYYDPSDNGFRNVVIENNLIYNTLNQYTVDLFNGLGDNTIIRNNTFVGRTHRNYDTIGEASLLYGFAMVNAAPAVNADPSTIIVANNLLVGRAQAPAGAIVKNNIVYHSQGFSQGTVGDNANNIVYYGGEPAGSEPQPFHGSGTFFVGGPLFDDWNFAGRHDDDLNEAFRLAPSADAVGYGDPTLATATDMTGAPRDPDAPSVGCYEYAPAVVIVPGDADGDGDVDLDDFVILKTNFGQDPLTDDRADFDADGDVDLDDFAILKSNFGN
ncbi:MAG: hypothetical protein ACOC95_00845 [Planctomycetota bacterium]